jgi:RNA recognition motif-containing protein
MNLSVGNIPETFTDIDLERLVAPFGVVCSVRISSDRAGRSRFGYVEMDNDDEARTTIGILHGINAAAGHYISVAEAPHDRR